MNSEVFNLPQLQVEPHQISEISSCLLHTIIFNRALGQVNEQTTVQSELFDISFVNCGDPTVNKRISDKVSQLYNWVQKNKGKKAQVCLSFYESRQTQAWFTTSEQRLYWEQWYINFEVIDSAELLEEQASLEAESLEAARKERLQVGLENCITTVIRLVNEKKDHIPPVVSGATVTFPFDITIAGEASGSSISASTFGLDLVRRMLSSTNPPSVLH